MSKKVNLAGSIALAAMLAFTIVSADPTGAAAKAQDTQIAEVPASVPQESTVPIEIQPTANPDVDADDATPEEPVTAANLQQLVARQTTNAPLSRELNCLAGAIYFESKSEPLLGQLAVGRVVVARSRSGRFPNSYCGVVYQPSQFSFVRGGGMPAIAKGSLQWKNAVALAQISHEGSWKSPVEGALYFHASRVSPGWRMARVGKLGNHVFYR
jgi:spore germination cell wall hydrolase CwlJ-like protein